jgi:hypothetical protein
MIIKINLHCDRSDTKINAKIILTMFSRSAYPFRKLKQKLIMMGLKDIEWIKRLKGDHRKDLGKKGGLRFLCALKKLNDWMEEGLYATKRYI